MARFFLGVFLCALAYPGANLVRYGANERNLFAVGAMGLFTLAGSVLLALLTLGVLRNRGWLRWWQLMAAGTLIGGMLPLAVLQAGIVAEAGAGPGLRNRLLVAGFFALYGALHALAFWVVAVASNAWLRGGSGRR